MRQTTLAITLVLMSSWQPAFGSEAPVKDGAAAAGSASVQMARLTPDVPFAAAPGREPVRQGLFRQSAVPVPMAKPWAWSQGRAVKRAERLAPEIACSIIEPAAHQHKVPVGLLTRLVWSESRFDAGAVSQAGAQGIAQFMPATAAERGLQDPFDPRQSLAAAASFLNALKQRFGNFGLAAAAYNGGPARVSGWLRNQRRLPEETRNYVKAVTGRTARSWAALARRKATDSAAWDKGPSSCIGTVFALAAGEAAR